VSEENKAIVQRAVEAIFGGTLGRGRYAGHDAAARRHPAAGAGRRMNSGDCSEEVVPFGLLI
jgi:hypothetical protein